MMKGGVMDVRGSERRVELGCVSFLNSKPLIEPLVGRGDVGVRFAVPSALGEMLMKGEVEAGLMSVVDYWRWKGELVMVPAGMIGCDGPTLTVRVFSKVPMEEVGVVHGDTDSHTSVELLRVVMRERYGREIEVVPLRRGGTKPQSHRDTEDAQRAGDDDGRRGDRDGATGTTDGGGMEGVEAMLLIGDKVVSGAPELGVYRYEMDLGEAWKGVTGRPFVFAMWMMRREFVEREGERARRVAGMLAEARRVGAGMTEELVAKYAGAKGWPGELARKYFTEYLRYEVTGGAREGMEMFFGKMGFGEAVRYLEF